MASKRAGLQQTGQTLTHIDPPLPNPKPCTRGGLHSKASGAWQVVSKASTGPRNVNTCKPELELTRHAILPRSTSTKPRESKSPRTPPRSRQRHATTTKARDSSKKTTSKLGFPKSRCRVPSTRSVHRIKPHNSSTETPRRNRTEAITKDHTRPIQAPQEIKLASYFQSAPEENGI